MEERRRNLRKSSFCIETNLIKIIVMKKNIVPSQSMKSFDELGAVVKDNNWARQNRIHALLKQLSAGMHEREQIIAVALLGAIAGHNTFLYGPPGTAKSLISRRLAAAFKSKSYFECLMNRFSTPEEVFGPVSIKELKEDRYVRKTDGYLPTAEFAFLDEIWKSSPGILNNLLTIINEHLFKNGSERVKVPLKSLVVASNEVPPENQGLDALYDRFIIRLHVPPIQESKNFESLLQSRPSSDAPEIDANLLIDEAELAQWRDQILDVQISKDTMQIVDYIRQELADNFDELNVYVSDRRWQRAAMLMKASAFCNGRNETNHSDAVLLKHCLWTTPENREKVAEIVMEAIRECGFDSGFDLAELDERKEMLDREINEELYYSEDVYDIVTLKNGGRYYRQHVKFKYYYYSSMSGVYFIPVDKFKKNERFHPLDGNGSLVHNVTVSFDDQGGCVYSFDHYGREDVVVSLRPLFARGEKKQDINRRLVDSLSGSVKDVRVELQKALKVVEAKGESYKDRLKSPFVVGADIDTAIEGILDQIKQLKVRIVDCERLENLCQ